LGSFATGVVVVTTRDKSGADVGMTANSFSSVSLKPRMILWSLANTSSNIEAFREADAFAVHVLASDQHEVSAQFATKGVDRFKGVEFTRSADGVPLLKNFAARFECRTKHRYDGGDHTIFVGEVIDFVRSE